MMPLSYPLPATRTQVIASDGAATDGDVADALRPLHDLPVWLVVRLCTDDDNVVNYWNRIDEVRDHVLCAPLGA